MTMNNVVNEELKKEWQQLRSNSSISEEELVLCEHAARKLRERLVHVPYYAERDRQQGMRYWRTLQASEYSLA